MWNSTTLKIQRTFQIWSKILELQKSFTTYKLSIIYIMCYEKIQFILQENIEIRKIKIWLWFEIFIILKDETLNLQGIGTFSKIHIYSPKKKNFHLLRKLYAFIIKLF
jgi:hypothetical protein